MLLNDMHTDWNPAHNDTRPAIVTLKTDGTGYWSSKAKPVQVTELALGYTNDDRTFGELRVYFNTDSWRPDRDGLIYTDMLFKDMLIEFLYQQGLDGSDVSYSEQGMQGDNFVSCDIGEDFITSWFEKYPDTVQ